LHACTQKFHRIGALREATLIDRTDATSRDVGNSLEVLTNLVYLTRHSLTDGAQAESYLDMAVVQLRRLTSLLST
jgi:hypothetical protein